MHRIYNKERAAVSQECISGLTFLANVVSLVFRNCGAVLVVETSALESI